MVIKHRNPYLVGLLGVITFGIYIVYWTIETRKEINNLGGKIANILFYLLPIFFGSVPATFFFKNNIIFGGSLLLHMSSIYFWYSYIKNFVIYILKDNSKLTIFYWFILIYFVPIILFTAFLAIGAIILFLYISMLARPIITISFSMYSIPPLTNELIFGIILFSIIAFLSFFVLLSTQMIIQDRLNKFKNEHI